MAEVSARSCPVDEGGAHPRARWANRRDFLFAIMGQISFTSFYTFPYLVYSFGGCAFFIPYGLTLFFLTFPLLVLETAVGQYTRRTGAAAWRMICPMLQGVGFASQIILAFTSIYEVVIPARILYYLYSSFYSPLPWTRCDGWYNSDSCNAARLATGHQDNQGKIAMINTTISGRNVLRSLPGVPSTHLNGSMVLCLFIAWIICYFCVWKGAKYLGKVFNVTVPFFYLLLVIMLIRGLTADHMAVGLSFLLPDLSRLQDMHTWIIAVGHAFHSWSMAVGVLTSLGSYNQYNTDYYRDCLLLMGIYGVTCILTCFTVFPIMGFLASRLNMSMNQVMSGGYYFYFVNLPLALSLLPAPSVWAVLLFLMLLLMSMNIQFVHADALATIIIDLFPQKLRGPCRRELLVLAIAVVCFLLGLPLLTKGGHEFIFMMDMYGMSLITLLFIATFETISVAWVYGADRFYRNMEDMLGYQVFPVLKYCWLFITPLICVVFILLTWISSLSYHISGFSNLHPAINRTFAFVLMAIPRLCIPLWILVTVCKNGHDTTTPSSDLRQSRPHLPTLTLCKRVICRAPAQPCRKDDGEGENLTLEAAGRCDGTQGV